ncbi:preprotein translocase subunit YajC [Miniimonas sp. S16]|uniref:preprotein translocase subunit YajC n=1 Tax=Miniimonas sp. S16 TaxID=2171623 RepID=UPI000D5257D8|nr:preprotein translocase subunit YajC [Miniimonas sp. S16]
MGESLPLILLLGVAVIGMLFMSQRGKKQQAKQSDFRNTLEPGQQVMTSSGQLGAVVEVVGDAVTIETTPGVQTRWVKAAIQAVPPQFASVLEPAESTEALEALDTGEATYVDDVLTDPGAERPSYGTAQDRDDEGTSGPARA